MKKHVIYWLALGLILIIGCQKEESFEIPNTPAGGSLQDDASGDCLPKTVNGTYGVGQALVPTTNTVNVQVNVTRTGSYTVYTDTVNGYYFRAVGTFTTLGNNTVTLRGNGTPFAAGTNNFVVRFDTTVCDLQVTVITPGVGILGGNPNACAPITVNGSYSPGAPLVLTNTAVVQVNVTTAGNFNFTTDTVGGIWFNFSGPLATGPQTVTLKSNGAIPAATALGNKTFTVKLGTSRCTFVVPFVAAGAATLGGAPNQCAPVQVNGIYANGSPLTAGHNVIITVTVATAGAVNITTDTKAGFSFAFSGTLVAGTQTVTLQAVGGPPSGTGNQVFTVTMAGSSCTFDVPISGNAVFSINCAQSRANGTYSFGTNLNGSNTIFLDITVASQGNYNLDIVKNGMHWTGSGFITVLISNITLTPVTTSAPNQGGLQNVTIMGCDIPINVTGGPNQAVYTINCPGVVVNGAYIAGTALNPLTNTIDIPINVTTPGDWSYLTNPKVNGMRFSGSGTVAAGPTTITIKGDPLSGPIAASPPNYNIVVNGCSIPITVQAPGSLAYTFSIGATTYSGTQTLSTMDNTSLPPYTFIDMEAKYNATTDAFYMILADVSGGLMTVGESYRTDAAFPGATNAGYFYFYDLPVPTIELETDPTLVPAGINITFTITAHSPVTKTIIGTITGTAYDLVSGTPKTISNGQFTIVYP
ncbi:MAG TPA: hypothetical protein VMZ03_08115 [Chitinophagaceae bacterium]|nr:hypothetical protein [Chitinophagaceae bacterium]